MDCCDNLPLDNQNHPEINYSKDDNSRENPVPRLSSSQQSSEDDHKDITLSPNNSLNSSSDNPNPDTSTPQRNIPPIRQK